MSTLDERIAADSAALDAAREATPVNPVQPGEDQPSAILEAVPHPEYDAPDTETPEAVETAPEASPEPEMEPVKEDDSQADKFKRMRLEAKEAKRRARELEAQIAAIQAGNPQAIDEAVVMQRAEQIAQAKLFNTECNKIAADGAKAFPDFHDTLADLWDTLNVPPGQVHVPLIEAAIEAGDPHKILHYLGTNPDEAERIASLPLHRQGAAVAKLAAKVSPPPAPKPVSKAPPPLSTVTGTASAPAQKDPLKMSFAEFEKQHQKQRHESIWGRPS